MLMTTQAIREQPPTVEAQKDSLVIARYSTTIASCMRAPLSTRTAAIVIYRAVTSAGMIYRAAWKYYAEKGGTTGKDEVRYCLIKNPLCRNITTMSCRV